MEEQEKALNFIEVAKAGIRYRKHILLITLIGAAIGVAVSFIIKPKYEAYTIFYTPANTSISKSLLAENNLENFMSYGDEDQIDQVLEMLSSDNLKDKVISKFNLSQHYNIDTASKYPKTKTRKQFESNTEFKRTDNLAIKISVKDEDPVLAAEMANYISLSLDSIRTNIQQGRAKQAYQIIKNQYQKKQIEVDSILMQLSAIRQTGVYDYVEQSRVLSEAIVNAETSVAAEEARVKVYQNYESKLPDTTMIKAKGRLAAAKATYQSLKPTVNNFGKQSGKYLELEAVYEKEKESLANLQIRLESAEVDFKAAISQQFLIEKANVPEKSTYPNKTLVVLLFALSAFIIALLTICYLEFLRPKFQ
ncbi:hypothetical protein A5893_12290 [Pedobacter psychrophilus]|uniref:Polysaccharide chain length determinant N-terminal domain-containing protein n=1 Tax=Pedobacter psychrophilus TaxID=1826909 RepID=A0A179DCX1_9SPHI|nr:Wzz/FepE/Etk N-terminal domain-containing protein [Pedobacter psychrophilus]OAQ38818.1 hypothetical protein A5893_12290 [Pedobacter psychrophilus]